MILFEILLLAALIICAVAALLSKRLLVAVVVYMAYGLVMSIIWALLQSPDLAITEAAVGAGITSLLLFLALKKIHAIDARNEVRRKHAQKQRGGEEHGEA